MYIGSLNLVQVHVIDRNQWSIKKTAIVSPWTRRMYFREVFPRLPSGERLPYYVYDAARNFAQS